MPPSTYPAARLIRQYIHFDEFQCFYLPLLSPPAPPFLVSIPYRHSPPPPPLSSFLSFLQERESTQGTIPFFVAKVVGVSPFLSFPVFHLSVDCHHSLLSVHRTFILFPSLRVLCCLPVCFFCLCLVCICMYIYIYIYMYMYVCTYIYLPTHMHIYTHM
jgi:hypothetical protein